MWLLPGQLVFGKGGRAAVGVARGESLFGWSCGNHASGTGAEEVLRRQMRRGGCVVFRKAAGLRL